jgi:hypothetical protein
MTKRKGAHGGHYDVRVSAAWRKWSDKDFAKTTWDIKRFAWAALGLKGRQRIYLLSKVMVHVGVGVGAASTGSESLPRLSCPPRPRATPWRRSARSQSARGGVGQDDDLLNRCWRNILIKQSQCLQLLSALLGCLRRAMWCRVADSSIAARRKCSTSHSLAGLPWDEFVRRVAAAEADVEGAVIVGAYITSSRPSAITATPSRTNSSGRADDSPGSRHN